MNTDALRQMVIVVFLGDRRTFEGICSSWVEDDFPSALLDINNPLSPFKETPQDGLRVLEKAADKVIKSRVSVLHVFGLLRFAADARELIERCPNLLVFDLQASDPSQDEVRQAFASARLIRVDPRRNVSSSRKFIRTRIRELVQSHRIQVASKPLQEPAFA